MIVGSSFLVLGIKFQFLSCPMTEKTDYGTVTENGQSVWTLIRRNIFKHRSQKHQDVDEVGVNLLKTVT